MMAWCPQLFDFEIRLFDNLGFVFATFENRELVLAIDLRQTLAQPQNILSDTGLMIVDESRVDADAHEYSCSICSE
jgi:hypothetical protein